MAHLLDRVRTAMRSLGNDGALANVAADMASAARDREAVELLVQRLAVAEVVFVARAA
jgi:hypothetical protein